MKYSVIYGYGCNKKWDKSFENFNEALDFAKKHANFPFSELVDNEPAVENNIIWTTQGPEGTHFEGKYFMEIGAIVDFSEGDRVVF